MKKVDGHTHTEYCPHGSGDYAEEMIQKAIELGFDAYHITEHAPMPDTFYKIVAPTELRGDIAMPASAVEDYLRDMLALQKKFAQDIQVKVGFEIDYVPTEVQWYRNFLDEYGKYCDTGILSVHFLKAGDCWRAIDYKPEDVQDNILPYYDNLTDFQLAYYRLVEEGIHVDLGPYKPKTIGHLTLCNKFQTFLEMEACPIVQERIVNILKQVKKANMTLDVNAAGLFKPFCKEIYPNQKIVALAKKMGIPLVYGSDAHSVADVGRGYEEVEEILCS